MNKTLKWLLISLGIAVLLLVLIIVIITLVVDVDHYKPAIEKKVLEITGRPLTINGNLDLSLLPRISLSLSDLHLGNPENFKEPEFISISDLDIRVKFWPLISSIFDDVQDIQVERFIVKQFRIILVRNQDGTVNWEELVKTTPTDGTVSTPSKIPTPSDETSQESVILPALTVGDLFIGDGTVQYIDHQNKSRQEISDIQLSLKDVSFEQPIQLDFSALFNKKPIGLNGKIGPLSKEFLREPIPLDIIFSAFDQLKIHLDGQVQQINPLPRIVGTLQTDPFSLRKLATALGQSISVETSDPTALNHMTLKADILIDGQMVAINEGDLIIDKSRMTFSAKLADFSKPDLTFDIKLDQIDLDRYIPPQSKGEDAGDVELRKKQFQSPNFAPLRQSVVDGKLTVGGIKVKNVQIQNIFLQLKGKGGIFHIKPMQMDVYGGNITAACHLNVRKVQPKTEIHLNASGVHINPLLKDTWQKDFIEGKVNAQVTLKLTGSNPEQVTKNLNGQVDLDVKNGAIKGVDLVSMVRNMDGAFGLTSVLTNKARTEFAKLKAPFTIIKGVAETSATEMASELLRIKAVGQADLVREKLKFRIEPVIVATRSDQSEEMKRSEITVPVLLSGSFNKPEFKPDLERAAGQAIKKKITESKEFKKFLQKKELKPFEGIFKELLDRF